jgi:hypothetical protein
MRQLRPRMPNVGETVLNVPVLAGESEPEALTGQVLCLQAVTNKSLGLEVRGAHRRVWLELF